MSIVRGLVCGLLAASCVFAQNLVGVDFEASSAISTANWPLQTAGNTFSIDTATQHAGVSSARVDVATSWCEFGKQWYFASGVNQTLKARVRVKVPQIAGARLRIGAEGIPITTPQNWNVDSSNFHLQGSTVVEAIAPRNWQNGWHTYELSYTPPAGSPPTSATLVRFWIVAINLQGQSFHVDSVDFTGSGAVYAGSSAMEQSCARAVTSTRLSLVYDTVTKRVRDLRNTYQNVPDPAYPDEPVLKFRENLLRDLAHSPTLNEGSDLFMAASRPSKGSPDSSMLWSRSRWYSVTTSAITNGWRFHHTNGNAAFSPVDVDVFCVAGRPEIFVEPSISVGTWCLESFYSPLLDFASASDGSNADFSIVTPRGGGAIVSADASFFNAVMALNPTDPRYWMSCEYPGAAALQLSCAYDGDTGVGVAAYDWSGENTVIDVVADAGTSGCQLSVVHRLPSAPTAIHTLQRAILPCIGTWMDAAEQYRAAVSQSSLWAAAAARTPAAWVQGRPTLFEAGLTPEGIGEELVPIDRWDDVMNNWSANLGGGMVPLFRGFENQGVFTSPYYLPFRTLRPDPLGSATYSTRRTEAEILTCWSDVRGNGHHAMTMMAGLKFSKSRVGANDPALYYSSGNCNLTRSRSYWIPTLPAPGASTPWANLVVQKRLSTGAFADLLVPATATWDIDHYVMDPQLPNTINLHTNLASTMAASGVHVYLFDQMNGGTVPDNFRGSTLGAGSWKVSAIRNLFSQTLSAGKGKDADFELAIEDPCEQSIDLIAMQGTRPTAMGEHPAYSLGRSRVVPLFGFVFSEVTAPVTWDLQMPSLWWMANLPGSLVNTTARQRVHWEMATTLTSGSWMATAITPWMLVSQVATGCTIPSPSAMEPTFAMADPQLRSFLGSCVRTAQGPALTFMNTGRMVGTSSLGSWPTISIYEKPQWQTGTSPTVSVEPILSAAWEIKSPTAPTVGAVVIANIDDTVAHTVTIPVKVGSTTLAAGMAIQRFDGGVLTATLTYGPGVTTITMGPRMVTTLVF